MGAGEVPQQLVVGGRLLQRVELRPVQVLQQGVQQQLVVLGGPDDRRDLLQPGLPGGPPAPLAHDELEAPRGGLAHHHRLEQAHLLDRGDQLGQLVLVEHLARLTRVGGDRVQREFGEVGTLHPGQLRLGGGLLPQALRSGLRRQRAPARGQRRHRRGRHRAGRAHRDRGLRRAPGSSGCRGHRGDQRPESSSQTPATTHRLPSVVPCCATGAPCCPEPSRCCPTNEPPPATDTARSASSRAASR